MVSPLSRSVEAKTKPMVYVSPAIGIVEDPVTGNADGPMGAWLVRPTSCPTMARCCVLKAMRGARGA
ncbi:PhzF family phenazine biosynthesis protein [Shigella flexneri]